MNCEQIQPNLLDYSKGALSGPESREIAKHLGKCAECAAVLEQEVAFAGKLAELPDVEPVNDVWALVRAQTKPRRLPLVSWLRAAPSYARRAVAATAVAAVVGITLLTCSIKPEPQQPVVRTPAPASTVAVKWTDDPLGDRADAMVASIDEM